MMPSSGFYPTSTSTSTSKPEPCTDCNRLLAALERITHVISSHQAVAIAKDALHPPKESK